MFKRKKRKNNKTGFYILVISVILIVGALGSATSRAFYRERVIEKEKDRLKKEIQEMEVANYKLSQDLEYYQTQEYKEAEARQRLNLKGEGEKVMMIENVAYKENVLEKELNNSQIREANYKKWWNYFFVNK